jgi:hypothetical protein
MAGVPFVELLDPLDLATGARPRGRHSRALTHHHFDASCLCP